MWARAIIHRWVGVGLSAIAQFLVNIFAQRGFRPAETKDLEGLRATLQRLF